MTCRDASSAVSRRAGRAIVLALAAATLASCAEWREAGMNELRSVREYIVGGSSEQARSRAPEPEDETTKSDVPNKSEVSNKDVRVIQERLEVLGYQPGAIDGLMGPQTAAAIRRYQHDRGLPVDGTLSAALHERLMREQASPAPRQRPATSPSAKVDAAPPAPAPVYQVGTSFVYSDGVVERVVATEGGRIEWTRDDGTNFTAESNFMLPHVYWETAAMRGRAKVDAPGRDQDGEAPWPGAVGSKFGFTVTKETVRRGEPNRLWQRGESWRCTNEDQVRLTVIAGTFDTFRFVCRVESEDEPPLRLVWYYAPLIRHFVRHERTREGGATESRDLVAARPNAASWPPLVRAGLEKEVVDALSHLADRGVRVWSSRGVDTKVTVKVFPRFAGRAGEDCRPYLQRWERGGAVHVYPGAACRTGAGGWRLAVGPGGTDQPLAVSAGP